MNKKIAFGWYGGKYSHLNWLLPLLSQEEYYLEPFGGSAAVLINRPPAKVETYNDLDKELVNFFRVLRKQKNKLIEAITLTPFSREEHKIAISEEKNISNLERARRFYIKVQQSRMALAKTATTNQWGYCRTESSRNMSSSVSRWLSRPENLLEVADRLLQVQIENKPAIDVIQRYDTEDILIYCDPPYLHDTRNQNHTSVYAAEMNEEDHKELARVLHNCSGKVAISGYHSKLYDDLYGDWFCTSGPKKKCWSGRSERQEVLWTNYDPSKIGQQSLFGR